MSRYTQYFGKNNVKSELAVGISSIATTIQVSENQGNLRGENFPVLGTLEHFDSTGKVSKREIVKVESRSGDSFTVVRKFAPCPPSDDATSQSAVSSSFDPGDSFSIYIPYEVFNAVSEAINDLYNNGNDRLFLKKTAGLGFEITPGNVRFETGEAYYPGGTGTVVDNSMNYVMLDSSFNIIVNQEELFDVQNISIAEVKAVNGEITEITTRKIDGIAGRMGGGGDPVYGDGSDGDLVISENTILNAGQQYNFSNLTICSGATVSFSGGGGAKIHVSGLFINEGTIDMTNLDVDNHQYVDSTSFCTLKNCGFFNENAGKGGYSGFLQCSNSIHYTCSVDCYGIRVWSSGAGGNGGGLSSPDSCSGCGGYHLSTCKHPGGYDGYQMGGGGASSSDGYGTSCDGCNANGNNGGNGGNGYQTGGNTGNKYAGGGGGGGYYNGKGGDGGCGSGIYCCSCSSITDWTAFRNFSRCSRTGGDGGNGGIIGNGGNGGCGGQSYAGGNGGEGICGGNGGKGGAGGNCYIESSHFCCSCYNRFVGGNGGKGGAGFYGGAGGNGGDYFSIWGTTCDCFTSGTRLAGFGGQGGDGVVPGNGGNGGNYCRRNCCYGIGGLTSTTYVYAGNGGQGGTGISALTSLNIKAKCFCNTGCILSVGSVGGRGGDGGCICGVKPIYNNMCQQCETCIHAGNGGNGGKGGNGGEIQIITGNLLEKGCISVAGGVGGQGGTGGASMYGCNGTAGSNGSAGSSGTSGTLNFFILEG